MVAVKRREANAGEQHAADLAKQVRLDKRAVLVGRDADTRNPELHDTRGNDDVRVRFESYGQCD